MNKEELLGEWVTGVEDEKLFDLLIETRNICLSDPDFIDEINEFGWGNVESQPSFKSIHDAYTEEHRSAFLTMYKDLDESSDEGSDEFESDDYGLRFDANISICSKEEAVNALSILALYLEDGIYFYNAFDFDDALSELNVEKIEQEALISNAKKAKRLNELAQNIRASRCFDEQDRKAFRVITETDDLMGFVDDDKDDVPAIGV